jgi:hypothetical protein
MKALADSPDPVYVRKVKAVGLARLAGTAALVGAALLALLGQSVATQPAHAAQPPQYQVPLTYLMPIPIVRIAGQITSTGARVTRLQIKSPRGSTVTVRCAGGRKRGCTFRSKTKHSPRSTQLRFREIEHRLRAGVKLSIFVRRGNTIGKYTRFGIRRRRAPSRTDSCLLPGDPFEPQSCP